MYNVEILPSAWEDLKSLEDYYAICPIPECTVIPD